MPNGTMTYTGILILVLTPILAKYGVTSEEVSAIVSAGGTVLGAIVAAYGRYRVGKTVSAK